MPHFTSLDNGAIGMPRGRLARFEDKPNGLTLSPCNFYKLHNVAGLQLLEQHVAGVVFGNLPGRRG